MNYFLFPFKITKNKKGVKLSTLKIRHEADFLQIQLLTF
jgi:hypothetical protein